MKNLFPFLILLCIGLFMSCESQQQPPQQEWPSKTKAILEDGTMIEICVYPEPIMGDGFVINVHRPDDPPGRCWGTVIYPKPVE